MGALRLDLDWELGVFKAARALWRSLVPEPGPYSPERAAVLEPLTPRLRVVAQLVAAHPVRLQAARGVGGLRGDDLLLPPWIELAADPDRNRILYVVRVAMNAGMHRYAPRASGDPIDDAVATLVVAERAWRALYDELPRFRVVWEEAATTCLAARRAGPACRGRAAVLEAWRQNLLAGAPLPSAETMRRALRDRAEVGPPSPEALLWGRLILAELEHQEPVRTSDSPAGPGGTEVEAPSIEDVKVVELDEQRHLELPIHAFEKVETLEGFSGSLRQLDGEDDLDDHLEALQEVDLSNLVRGGPEAAAVLRAEVGLEADIPDVARIGDDEEAILYDEWDPRRRRYREGWCRVYPTALPTGSQRWADEAMEKHCALIEQLYGRLVQWREQRRCRPRQLDGASIDTDAVVDARATLAAGREPDPRLYRAWRRHQRDLATLVLMDLSLSTDSWFEDRRVLDVSREAVLVLGELAHRLGDRLQVTGFASHTRNRVRAFGIKGWREPWSSGRGRLGLLRPQGYTRIGPALRHATAELGQIDASHRVLLLLTDGKPTDYDRYEGRYGLGDVRCAVREARSRGIAVHALTVDSRAREALPAMMGPGGWSVLPHPDQLPEALSRVWARHG
ncbi:MAG: hypothetical protein H6739_35850 [Alphaproteobacteria bacterium]|nr:hypothetical protein [Alphaproteobacteria bacterium]